MKHENQTIAPMPEMTGLTIAPGVTLPTETITARNGIFGISGSGKTYSASDVAEEMLAAFMHVVVFDPLGVWWGLASVAEGQEPVDGTPLYIFGGDHADVPLDPASGAAIADLVVNDGLSVVLDMSNFDDDAQMATFVAAFSTRLRHGPPPSPNFGPQLRDQTQHPAPKRRRPSSPSFSSWESELTH